MAAANTPHHAANETLEQRLKHFNAMLVFLMVYGSLPALLPTSNVPLVPAEGGSWKGFGEMRNLAN
jgi:hypothetical protein